ncbi:MAG TPA: TadE/TadG family type IV pilus assembly protein [Terriglobales bacterium]|nr:TadE/TadG family type IV pilus assembly protein [Terriglobales bacterium]
MFRKLSLAKDSRGQSLVETAFMIPLLLMLILNAVNFGYFLLVTLNLTSATRNGIEYAIQGSSTPTNGPLPQAGTALSQSDPKAVSALIALELGTFNNGNLGVQVCSLNVGTTTGTQPKTQCTSIGKTPGTLPSPDPDPEAATYPGFALNRIDVWYTFRPLIPATPFSLAVLSMPACSSSGGTTSCQFSRHAEMRAMGS